MGEPRGAVRAVLDLWRATREGEPGLARRRNRRLAALVAHAASRSPFYARRYRGLPLDRMPLAELPPVTKPELMAAFDEWVTDPEVTRARVEAFLADRSRIGSFFLDRYFACTSSGTTGHPGIFVHDWDTVVLYRAFAVVRLDLVWLTGSGWLALLRRGGRWASIIGSGGHFAAAAWIEIERRRDPFRSRAYRVFSAQLPLAELVTTLNAFDPAILTGYPSCLELLASEQAAGRLRVRPVLLETGGESMKPGARARVAAAFGRPVFDVYGSSEFLHLAAACRRGRLHVNSDWVVLEPVDAALRPTPVGEQSHTVLLTSFASRLQPLIRYDLGDSVLMRPDPCPCGSPLPTLCVSGRRDDVLALTGADGRIVKVPPLAITAVIDDVAGVRRSQLVQTAPAAIEVRLDIRPDAGAETVWRAVLDRLGGYLAAQACPNVVLVRVELPPERSPLSGKFRQVIARVSAASAHPS